MALTMLLGQRAFMTGLLDPAIDVKSLGAEPDWG
jgi:hypothetical protein